jgi:probable HAF family extracellular repeat protein
MTDIGAPPNALRIGGVAINDQGQVLGDVIYQHFIERAVLYANGSWADLGTLPGGTYTVPYGINDSGDVVGFGDIPGCQTCSPYQHAFLYTKGAMVDLGTLGGGASVATAINGKGEIVGYSDTSSSALHVFLYSKGSMADLGVPSGGSYVPSGINNAEEVVGGGAFLYRDGTWFDLNSLIDPHDRLYGAITLTSAAAINNIGQIVANGCYTSGPLNGVCDAFLLDPVLFAGTPGYSNCHGKSVSALAQQYGGLNGAAAALGYADVSALQDAIETFCSQG